jgi:hypothetical protein
MKIRSCPDAGSFVSRVTTAAAVLLILSACRTSAAMTLAPVWQSGGPSQALAVDGDRAYLAAGGRVLVADVADPTHPLAMGESEPIGEVLDLAAVGDRAYALGPNGLSVIDASEPAQPRIHHVPKITGRRVVAVGKGLALLSSEPSIGVTLLDLSDPNLPRVVGQYMAEERVTGLARWRDSLLVAVPGRGIDQLDVSDLAAPQRSATILAEPSASDVAVAGDRAYIATRPEDRTGMSVLDLSSEPAATLGFVPLVVDLDSPASMLGASKRYGIMQVDAGPVRGAKEPSIGLYSVDPPPMPRIVNADAADGPRELAVPDALRWATKVVGDGDRLYVLGDDAGLRIFRDDDLCEAGVLGILWTIGTPSVLATAPGELLVGVDTALGSPSGLRVLDTSRPEQPVVKSGAALSGRIGSVARRAFGVHALRTGASIDEASGVWHVDDRDPAHPRTLAWWPTDMSSGYSPARRLATQAQRAYLADRDRGLLSIPAKQAPTGFPNMTPVPQAQDVQLVVADDPQLYGYSVDNARPFFGLMGTQYQARLDVLQGHGSGAPRLVGRSAAMSVPNDHEHTALTADGQRVYLASRSLGLRVFDVAHPDRPTEIGHLQLAEDPLALAAAGDLVFVAVDGEDADSGPSSTVPLPRGILIVDVSDPRRPRVAGRYDGCPVRDVAAADGLVYCAGGESGLQILRPVAAPPSVMPTGTTQAGTP